MNTSLYPTRDHNFRRAADARLKHDPRQNVYGSDPNSLLVRNSYPELSNNYHSSSPSKQQHWAPISINEYTIIKKIGSGTYGSVFHAKSPNNMDVAIKQLSPMQNKEHIQDGFHITAIREIKILKALKHTNIISLHDVLCCKGMTHTRTHPFTLSDHIPYPCTTQRM